MRHVQVVLEYFHPWPNSSGFHVAASEGWYRELDLDVDLRAFDPLRGDGLDYLLRREAELAVVPSNRLLHRRELRQPLQGIAAINHRALETIQTTTSTGISRPGELAGRRVALNPTPRGRAMLRHLVALDGGDPDAIVVVDSGVRELTASDIAEGTVDAIFGGYWAWDVLFGALPAGRHIVWPIDEIGAPAYHSYLLGAHEELIEGEPELVEAFLAATERGFLTAAVDPELTLAVLERVMPYFPADVLAQSLRLIAPTWTYEGRWGEQRDELLAPYATWLAQHGVLHADDAWIGATTNELLPEPRAMTEPDDPELVAQIADRALAAPVRAGRTRIVAIDGRSGSGKSTLARQLALRVAAPVVDLELIYPGWDGLEQGVELLVRDVLEPFEQSRPARVPRYDWQAGRFGEPWTLEPPELAIIEGVGAGARSAARFASVLVWIELAADVRMARALARDGELFRPHWQRWKAQEESLLGRERTPERADILVDANA